ncbi:hypothetical protein V2J09_017382 [Rumex salicifolius]
MRHLLRLNISRISTATARQFDASYPHRRLHTNRVTRCAFSPVSNAGDAGGDPREFQNWGNGGGIFHNSAFIDPTAILEVGAVVHSRAILGANVQVGSGAVIGPGVAVGQSSKIGYNVALSNCKIGDSCVIHHGACIGQDGTMAFVANMYLFPGYGFFVDDKGNMIKKAQVGDKMNVRIGNFVEIGANTCVDRGSWRDTEIGDHTKIDNQVQIGHNVVIGKCCIICGQAGIAGSVIVKDYVTFGGRVAVRDHVTIVSKVRLAANSCVTKDITVPGDYAGFPAVPVSQWRRQVAGQRCSLKAAKLPNVSFEEQGEE